jgi:hypothetical protein
LTLVRSGASAIDTSPDSLTDCRSSRACWSVLFAHLLIVRRSLDTPVSPPLRRASGGRVSGSGSPTGIACEPRRTATLISASSNAAPVSGSTAGRPRRVARSSQRVPLRPITRVGCVPALPSGKVTGIWQTNSVPNLPSRSVAVPPRRIRSAAIWGRTSLHRSPFARSSEHPQLQRAVGTREHDGLHVAGRLVDLQLELGACHGQQHERAEVDATVGVVEVLDVERTFCRLFAPCPRLARRLAPGRVSRPRRRRRPLLPCGGTSRGSFLTGRSGAESPGRTVAPGTALRPGQFVDDHEAGPLETLDNQLCDAVASAQLDRLVKVVVDQTGA